MRAALAEMVGGGDTFKGSAFNRLTADWPSLSLSEKEEYQNNARVLRNRCRDLQRNNPFFKRWLHALSTNVIGKEGATLRSTDQIEDAWWEWSKGPVSLDGKLNLARFQSMALKSLARDGELFIRLWPGREYRYGLALEPIDPDLVQETFNRLPASGGNEIQSGIEIDSKLRPVAYHVSDSADPMLSRRVYAIPAKQIIHLYDPDRVSSIRGLPWSTSVMLPLRWLQGYIEAELVAARQGSNKAGWLTKKEGSPGQSILSEDGKNLYFEATPGSVEVLPTGYDFVAWDPTHPTNAFPEFVKLILLEVAAGLNVSYPTLTGDTSMANYSSMRSGKIDERDEFRRLQGVWEALFLRPVHRAWLEFASLSGALDLGSFDLESLPTEDWIARGWDWVDPQVDVQAAKESIEIGLSSRKRYLDQQGIDVDEIFKELSDETQKAKKLGIEIVAAKPAPPPGFGQKPGEKGNGEPPTNGNGNGSKSGGRLAPYVEAS